MPLKPPHTPKARYYGHFNCVRMWCPCASREVRFFYEQAFSVSSLGCTCTLTPRSRESNCWSRWCPSKKSNSPTTSWISTATWVALLVGKGKGIARLCHRAKLAGERLRWGKSAMDPTFYTFLGWPLVPQWRKMLCEALTCWVLISADKKWVTSEMSFFHFS